MSSTINEMQTLVRNGQLRYLPVSVWSGLPEDCRMRLLQEARDTPPLSHSAVPLERKNLLRSYMSQGLLRGFHSQDLRELTAEDAEFFIQCAEVNRWQSGKSLFEHYRQTEIDTAPADPQQLARIVELEKCGNLNRLASEVLLKLTHLSARRLIWRGEMNRREATHVPDQC